MSRTLRLCFLAFAVVRIEAVAGPAPAGAADGSAPQVLKDQSGSTDLAAAGSLALFTASQTDKSVTARVGRQSGSVGWSLEIKAPVATNAGASESALADLDGLTASTTAALKALYIWFTPPKNAAIRATLCEKDAFERGVKFDPTKEDCDESFFSGPHKRALRDQFVRLSWGDGVLPLVGLTAKAGRQKFDWVDVPTLTKHSDNKDAYSLAAYFGVLTLDNLLLNVGFRYEDAYKGDKTVSVCTPVPGTSASQCSDGALRAPTRSLGRVITLETRKFFGGVAIQPRFNYDLATSTFNPTLTGYFLQDNKARLVGGVRVGWRSDTKDVSAGLFVGSAFDLIN